MEKINDQEQESNIYEDVLPIVLSANQQKHMKIVWDIIQKLNADSKSKTLNKSDIMKEAKIQGIKSEEVDTALYYLSKIKNIHKTQGKYGKTYYKIK